jgi:polyisoprenoid-binding protein YceI
MNATLLRKTCLGALMATAMLTAHATEFRQLLPAKSTISFVAKQMNVPVEGSFKRFTGVLVFDPAKPAAAHATLDIDLASIDAGSDEANDEVAGTLWFNTKQFPSARFVTSSIKALGNNRFAVTGNMTIKGHTHAVATSATFSQVGGNAVLDGVFVLKRADYGIGVGMWAGFDTVANEIQIKFHLEAAATDRK